MSTTKAKKRPPRSQSSGRATPRRQQQTVAKRQPIRFRLPDGTRSDRSPWVWRALFMMALVALGLSLSFFVGGKTTYGAAWAAITAGWLSISMWLWRRHHIVTS